MHKWIIISCLFFSMMVHAQDSIHLRMQKKIVGSFSYMAPDGLDNVLVVTKSGQLIKYNASLDSIATYNVLKQLGRVHSIASFNALRTGVFFNQFKTILLLDRFLKEINRIDLRKAQLYQVNAVAQSFDNKWWVFDEQEAKLKKIGEDGRVDLETADMRVLVGESISPRLLFDQQRNVYAYDDAKGIYIFDEMGAFKKKLALIGWKDVQPFGNGFIGIRQGKLLVYVANKPDVTEYFLPAELAGAQMVGFTAEGCFALFSDGITKYTWQAK